MIREIIAKKKIEVAVLEEEVRNTKCGFWDALFSAG